MAKCLEKNGEVKRLSENNSKEVTDIINMVKTGGWKYVPKSVWKKMKPKVEKTENSEKKKGNPKGKAKKQKSE